MALVEPSSCIGVYRSDERTRRKYFKRFVANLAGKTGFLEGSSCYQVFGKKMVNVKYKLRHNISRLTKHCLCQESGNLYHLIVVALGRYFSSAKACRKTGCVK